ncbi:TonB-dependent receptor domain-containing protein [Sphingomonas sp. MMS24-JH45]
MRRRAGDGEEVRGGGEGRRIGRRLELTAAVFRNERTNYRVPSNDPALPAATQVLDGRARVDGIALGASGNITPAWTIFANYTYLDGKVRQSISNRDLAAGLRDPQAGADLHPDARPFGEPLHHLQAAVRAGGRLRPHLRRRLRAERADADRGEGGLTRYIAPTTTSSTAPISPTASAAEITAQVNVQNLTDKRYLTGVRNNGWAAPGDRRQAVLQPVRELLGASEPASGERLPGEGRYSWGSLCEERCAPSRGPSTWTPASAGEALYPFAQSRLGSASC